MCVFFIRIMFKCKIYSIWLQLSYVCELFQVSACVQWRHFRYDSKKKIGFVCLNVAWIFKDRVIELQTHNALSVLVALGLFPIGKSVHPLVHTYNLLIFPLQFRYRSPSSISLSLSLSTRVPFQIAVVKIVVASQLHGKLVHLTY